MVNIDNPFNNGQPQATALYRSCRIAPNKRLHQGFNLIFRNAFAMVCDTNQQLIFFNMRRKLNWFCVPAR